MDKTNLTGARLDFSHFCLEPSPHRDYEIRLQPAASGGGWELYCLLDGAEAERVAFPLPSVGEEEILSWWATLPETERSRWWNISKIPLPSGAWRAYQMFEAYARAEAAGEEWLACDLDSLSHTRKTESYIRA